MDIIKKFKSETKYVDILKKIDHYERMIIITARIVIITGIIVMIILIIGCLSILGVL
jgi:hypothetical protein